MDELEAKALEVLDLGGVIVHATEGVFGLACKIECEQAVEKISSLKNRQQSDSPYLVLAANYQQIETIVDLNVPYLDAIKSSWPGPVTWVFPKKTITYPWIGGADGSLAVRYSAHPQCQRLVQAAGPLISTSANRHGEPSPVTLATVRETFGELIACYLPGRLTVAGRASRIRHAQTGEWLR